MMMINISPPLVEQLLECGTNHVKSRLLCKLNLHDKIYTHTQTMTMFIIIYLNQQKKQLIFSNEMNEKRFRNEKISFFFSRH